MARRYAKACIEKMAVVGQQLAESLGSVRLFILRFYFPILLSDKISHVHAYLSSQIYDNTLTLQDIMELAIRVGLNLVRHHNGGYLETYVFVLEIPTFLFIEVS
jgi:hypothetical protein